MRRPIVFHPLLFALYPILFLFARNAELFPISSMFRPAFAAVLGVTLALLLFRALSVDNHLAGLVTSAGILLTFSYGHVQAFASTPIPAAANNKLLLTTFGLVFAVAVRAFVKAGPERPRITSIANAVALVLVALPLGQMAIAAARSEAPSPSASAPESAGLHRLPAGARPSGRRSSANNRPDIYYFILDAYGRADVLQTVYGIDNAPLIQFLTRRGFYVASASQANYPQTELSLASSLNMTYLDTLAQRVGTENPDRGPLTHMIWDSAVRDFLHTRGYVFESFATAADFLCIKNADVYVHRSAGLTEFETALVETTALRPVLEHVLDPYAAHRDRINFLFDRIADPPRSPAPRFVFAHAYAPHPPFVFGPSGEARAPNGPYTLDDGLANGMTPADYVAGYRDAVSFVNRSLEVAIDGILEESRGHAIIVIQGDHGPGKSLNWNSPETMGPERFPILNAYHLPDGGDGLLYPSISPVNTFRIILDYYFGANRPLLPDKSFFASFAKPYDFLLMPPTAHDSSKAASGHERAAGS